MLPHYCSRTGPVGVYIQYRNATGLPCRVGRCQLACLLVISETVVAVALVDATVLVLPTKAHHELVVDLHGTGSNVLETVSALQANVQLDYTHEAEHKHMPRISNEYKPFVRQGGFMREIMSDSGTTKRLCVSRNVVVLCGGGGMSCRGTLSCMGSCHNSEYLQKARLSNFAQSPSILKWHRI